MTLSLEQARESVRRYYNNNSASFEKYGQGATTFHRAVWGPGVHSRAEAFRYLDQLVAQDIAQLGAPAVRVLDLGCGVGASLLGLAVSRPELSGVGVTLSARQAERATELIAAEQLQARITCIEADFMALPAELASFDLAFAFESFVHCPDAGAFFRSVARHVKVGGRLIICDDFLVRDAASAGEQRWIDRFRDGWLAHGLGSVAHTVQHAEAHGFKLVEDLDLSHYLELRRPRDRVLSLLLFLGSPLRIDGTLWKSWQGGDALQRALVNRLIAFHCLRFERIQRSGWSK